MAKRADRKNVVSFVAAGCRHCPLQDKRAIDDLIAVLEDVKPDYFVDLGDFLEADSASRWPSEYGWTYDHELREDNKIRRLIRRSLPRKTQLIQLEGNHDNNYMQLGRIDPKYRDFLDWTNELTVAGEWLNEELCSMWQLRARYLYCRRRGVFRLGQVTFGHGYEAGQSADEFQSLLLGVPFGLWVGAHTHRPIAVEQAHRTKAVPLPYWYANAGCLRNLKPPYMERKRTHAWGHGCVVGEADLRAGPAKSPRYSCCWDAETRIFRRYDEWKN